jgi:RNA polymerase sigma-70 factor (ECF subfamily)
VATSEDDLIVRAAEGDQDAFRQLWEAHYALALAKAYRLCHQRAMAEEITQGAFLLAWRGLPGFQQGNAFRPWFMRILYRHALDVMEKQRHYAHPVSLVDISAWEVLNDQSCRLESLDMQEVIAQREEIRQALTRLTSDQRRVIALRYGADMTEADIAHVLDWPIGTVKSRLNRARQQLRRYLVNAKEEGVYHA